MATKKPLRIGLIGYGFMGRAHSNAYRRLPNFFRRERTPVLQVACGRNAEKLQAFAEEWGYEACESDWRRLIARDDVDLIDIGAPNHLHRDIALAAADAGKMVACEKPLAMSTAEAEEMTAAVERAGVANMVLLDTAWPSCMPCRRCSHRLSMQVVDKSSCRPAPRVKNHIRAWCRTASCAQQPT